MSAPLTLSAELRKLVEARLEQTLRGIEDTFNQILEKQEITESGNSLHATPKNNCWLQRIEKDP